MEFLIRLIPAAADAINSVWTFQIRSLRPYSLQRKLSCSCVEAYFYEKVYDCGVSCPNTHCKTINHCLLTKRSRKVMNTAHARAYLNFCGKSNKHIL